MSMSFLADYYEHKLKQEIYDNVTKLQNKPLDFE